MVKKRKVSKIIKLKRPALKKRNTKIGPIKKRGEVVQPAVRRGYLHNSYLYDNPTPGLHTLKIGKKPSPPKKTWLKDKRVVIFAHFYYDDLIEEMCDYMDLLPLPFTLWASLPDTIPANPSPNTIKKKKYLLKRYPKAQIRIVPNRGKDIGGKLKLLEEYLNTNGREDWMIFCHDKKSPHMTKPKADRWREDLLSSVFAISNVHRILSTFKNFPEVKMCGGRVREGIINSRSIAVNKGNEPYIYEMAKLFGIVPGFNHPKYSHIKASFNTGAFVGGTMFWVDSTFYRSMFKHINIQKILQYLENGDVKEPSRTHAVERLLGLIVTFYKYKIGSL